jgi:hypothetical protein
MQRRAELISKTSDVISFIAPEKRYENAPWMVMNAEVRGTELSSRLHGQHFEILMHVTDKHFLTFVRLLIYCCDRQYPPDRPLISERDPQKWRREREARVGRIH